MRTIETPEITEVRKLIGKWLRNTSSGVIYKVVRIEFENNRAYLKVAPLGFPERSSRLRIPIPYDFIVIGPNNINELLEKF